MRVLAPAKINLVLDVLGKRPDGYHEVAMIMHSLQWGDVLDVELADDIRITCTNPAVPLDERNLVYRAVQLLGAVVGGRGAHVHIDKLIPLEAGLGGGSADAAAALRALSSLWGLDWDVRRLAAFSLPLGSDVPYCVHQGPALAEGRGERLTPLPEQAPLSVVLATPRVQWPGPKTATVYRRFDAAAPRQPRAAAMANALRQGTPAQIAALLGNDLELPAMGIHPAITQLKAAMLAAGALGAAMSGAGPTVFAVVEPSQTGVVACAAQRFTDLVVQTRTAH